MSAVRFGYLLAVWIHVTAVVVWVGSMVFLGLVLIPVLRRAGTNEPKVLEMVALRLRCVGWVCILLIVLTGLYQLPYRGFGLESWASGQILKNPLGQVLVVKLFLVLIIIGTSFLHDFYFGPNTFRMLQQKPGARQAEKLRRISSIIGRMNLLLSLVVIALAVMLVRGLP